LSNSDNILRNECVTKYLTKFGGSFDWKEIQEIKGMLPSKETFDKKADKNGEWTRSEMRNQLKCTGSSIGFFSALDTMTKYALGNNCEKFFKKFGKTYDWAEVQLFRNGFPTKEMFDKGGKFSTDF